MGFHFFINPAQWAMLFSLTGWEKQPARRRWSLWCNCSGALLEKPSLNVKHLYTQVLQLHSVWAGNRQELSLLEPCKSWRLGILLGIGIPHRSFRNIPVSLTEITAGFIWKGYHFRVATPLCASFLINGDGAMEVITQSVRKDALQLVPVLKVPYINMFFFQCSWQ